MSNHVYLYLEQDYLPNALLSWYYCHVAVLVLSCDEKKVECVVYVPQPWGV
jgi:hypothetical protein